MNDVQPDLFAMRPGGIRIPIQVAVTNLVDYETDCLVRLAEDGGTNRVVIITVTRKKAATIHATINGVADTGAVFFWSGSFSSPASAPEVLAVPGASPYDQLGG